MATPTSDRARRRPRFEHPGVVGPSRGRCSPGKMAKGTTQGRDHRASEPRPEQPEPGVRIQQDRMHGVHEPIPASQILTTAGTPGHTHHAVNDSPHFADMGQSSQGRNESSRARSRSSCRNATTNAVVFEGLQPLFAGVCTQAGARGMCPMRINTAASRLRGSNTPQRLRCCDYPTPFRSA